MSTLGEKLTASAGSGRGRAKPTGVPRSAEFRRVEALPRRRWQDAPDLEEVRSELTRWLRLPGSAAELWPRQAAALADLMEWRGLLGPMGVGAGKTLVSMLAGTVTGAERPVLLVPASLRDKAHRELPELRRHWRIPGNLTVVGYPELSIVEGADLLDRLRPDLIVADEAHLLARPDSGRTRRVKRYLDEYPGTMFAALSGTITRKSLRDYWALARWALKPDLCPLPTSWRDLQDWADAIDEGVPEHARVHPGALKYFCVPGEAIRSGFERRLNETPGVVSCDGADGVAASLRLRDCGYRPGPAALAALHKLRTDWETPNGDFVTQAVDLWRHARELALGFWYRWKVPPPPEWLEARRAYKGLVRHVIVTNRRGLDTELQVTRSWTDDPPPEYSAWLDVEGLYEPETVAEWVDDEALRFFADRLRREPALAWCEHGAFGRALAERAGLEWYGAGRDDVDRVCPDRSVVLSIRAHSTGKNLQAWSTNVVVSPPASGAGWEQLAGRTHRHGQEADAVYFEVNVGAPELLAGIARALGDARYVKETTGQGQKLLVADVEFEVG